MGPNSQRGKKQAGPPVNVPARARFSNWKPPVTKKKQAELDEKGGRGGGRDGGGRGGRGRGGGRGGDDRQQRVQSSLIKQANAMVRKGPDQLPPGMNLADLETLQVSNEMVNQMLLILHEAAREEEGEEEEDEDVGEQLPAPAQKITPALAPPPVPVPLVSKPVSLSSATKASTSAISVQPQSREDRALVASFSPLGFSVEEILGVARVHRSSIGDEDELLSLLIAHVCSQGRTKPTGLNSLALIALHDAAAENADLGEENDSLVAIYGGALSSRRLSLLGTVCSVLDLELDLNAKPRALKPSLRIVILNSHKYPHDPSSASVYCWLTFSSMPSATLREIALSATRHVATCLDRRAPCLFDLVQHVQSALIERGAADAAVAVGKALTLGAGGATSSSSNTVGKANSAASSAQAGGNGKGTGAGNGKSKMKASAPAEPVVAPLAPAYSKPVTKHTESPEYRVAFNQALTMGLAGQAARTHAFSLLEPVLPSSILAELKAEEELLEILRSRAVNLETASIKCEIEAMKTVVAETDAPKTRARALLAQVKLSMIADGRHFARDEKALVLAWVNEAVVLYRSQVSSKESKLQEKRGKMSGRSNRGPTIRDAYEQREAAGVSLGRKGVAVAANDEQSEEDGEMDEDEQSEGDDDEDEDQESSAAATNTQHVENIRQKARQRELSSSDLKADDPQRAARLELESRRLRNALEEKRQSNNKYVELLSVRANLPAFQMRTEIVEVIKRNRVVVLSGDTGCGKTTQIPQLVLDDAIDNGCGGGCNMIVTQPRRISAMSVAERIAQERCEKVGETAGYHIRLEAKKSVKTRILLMTTGVLLRKLQIEGELVGISHVFVDEVHERDINTDFLLIVLKQLLERRDDLKVVLMSATLNAELFSKYFSSFRCTLINIPGRAFPVTTYFLEDALEQTRFKITPSSDCAYKMPNAAAAAKDSGALKDRQKRLAALQQTLATKCSPETLKSLEVVDEAIINKDLIRALVEHIHTTLEAGAILIFVPGLAEIRDVVTLLKDSRQLDPNTVKVLPLHSSLSSAEQQRVFNVPPPAIRKIVVSTNIAETSVTIPDVVFVIDTVRVKQNAWDPQSQISTLEEAWVSQANSRQRRGRAGRVRSGVCFHLTTSYTFHALPAFTTPEMLRLSLEELILQILALDLGEPYAFLGSAISPPPEQAIRQAIGYLDDLDAVFVDKPDGDAKAASATTGSDEIAITPLGFHLASLPISPRIGKLILHGVLMQCIDPILTIAATVSAKSPFLSPFEARDAADEAKQRFAADDSDLLATLSAYHEWKATFYCGGGRGGRGSQRAEDAFCHENFLSLHSLQLIDQMRSQFLDLLIDIGFLPGHCTVHNLGEQPENRLGGDVNMLRCVLTAGLSPNLLRIPNQQRQGAKKIAEIPLDSRRGGVNVHPSSIKANHKSAVYPYFVYLEAIKTAKVYVRDVTSISPITCILFGGRLRLYESLGALTVDGWIGFKTTPVFMRLLLQLKGCMDKAFAEKVLDPLMESSGTWLRVLGMIETLVSGSGGSTPRGGSALSSRSSSLQSLSALSLSRSHSAQSLPGEGAGIPQSSPQLQGMQEQQQQQRSGGGRGGDRGGGGGGEGRGGGRGRGASGRGRS